MATALPTVHSNMAADDPRAHEHKWAGVFTFATKAVELAFIGDLKAFDARDGGTTQPWRRVDVMINPAGIPKP